MGVVHATMAVEEDTPLRSTPYLSSGSGEPVASLQVGEYEGSVFGPPAALRRLAAEAQRAAEDAERLARADLELAAAGGQP